MTKAKGTIKHGVKADPKVKVEDISLEQLKTLTNSSVKDVREQARKSGQLAMYARYMDAVTRAMTGSSGGLTSSSGFMMDGASQVPVPTNTKSSEEINIPLFYSDFQYDVGQGPNDDFLFEELYKKDPYIATALEIHSEIPLSKFRLGRPKSKYTEVSQMIHEFYERSLSEMTPTLTTLLQELVLDWNMKGRAAVFFTWDKDKRKWVSGALITPFVKGYRDPFSGKLRVRLQVTNAVGESFSSFLKDNKFSSEFINEVMELVGKEDGEVELPTDPYKGSFVYYVTRRERHSSPEGISLLSRLKRVARYRSKLMSLQEVIMTRNMFAKHIVFADIDQPDQLEELRADIAISNINPDYEIIVNYKVEWNTVTAKERLMELTNEWTETEKQYTVGLNLPVALLTGEGRYDNERLSIELLNTRYAIVRDLVKDLVENKLFRPMAFHNNFYERDESKECLIEEFWKRDDDPLNFTDVVPDGSLDHSVLDVRERVRKFKEKYSKPHMRDELAKKMAEIGTLIEETKDEKEDLIRSRLNEAMEQLSYITEKMKTKLSVSRIRSRIRDLRGVLSGSSFVDLPNWGKVVSSFEKVSGETVADQVRDFLKVSSDLPDEQKSVIQSFVDKVSSDAEEENEETTQYILARLGKKIKNLSKYKLLDDPTVRFLYPKVSFKRVSITDPAEAFSQLFNLFTQQGLPLGPLLDLFDFDESQVEEELKHNFLSPKQSGQQELFSSMFGEVGRKLADNPAILKKIVESYVPDKSSQAEILAAFDKESGFSKGPPEGGPTF